MNITRIITSLVFAVAAAGASSCDTADKVLDCQEVCSRYKTCLGGKDTDVGSCRDKCQKAVDDNSALRDKLDDCAGCLNGDMSCSSSTFKCATECGPLVPAIATE